MVTMGTWRLTVKLILIHRFHTKISETQEQKHGSPVSIFKRGITVQFILKRSDLSFSPTGPQTIDGGESGRAQVYH
jgi:hypothetical protein